MLYQSVNGYDMPYLRVGQGETLVCVHGSLGDFRVWAPVLGPLSRRHSVIAVSLRHFFPGNGDGQAGSYRIARHIDDMVAFLEALGGKVNLLGHSRGGHIAFHVARRRPDLLHRVILAEPGGELDASRTPSGAGTPAPMRSNVAEVARMIAAGDVDGGLEMFMNRIDGEGAWARYAAGVQQELRDNAMTLVAQVNEERQPFSRTDAEAIKVPALFIGGGRTPGSLPFVLRALAAHVPGARTEIMPDATHMMFDQDPVLFSRIVLDFLAAPLAAAP